MALINYCQVISSRSISSFLLFTIYLVLMFTYEKWPLFVLLQDVYDARYSYSAKYSKITNVNNSPIRFLIEETNHPDDIRDMGPVDVVMLCFNILKPQSLHSLYLNWRRMIPVSAKILLVGCQVGLLEQKVVQETLKVISS